LHDIRHSTASALINAGVDLYTVGQVLGHKSLASTARYAHLDMRSKIDAINKIK
jgi:site-specific recombinase XerD